MKLLSIAMLIAAGAAAGWTLHLRRIDDPAWKLALAAALAFLAAGLVAPRLEAVIFSLLCWAVSMYFLWSFRRELPTGR